VNNAAISTGLVQSGTRFLLQDKHALTWKAPLNGVRGGETNDSRADYGDVYGHLADVSHMTFQCCTERSTFLRRNAQCQLPHDWAAHRCRHVP
jgi:hypothetical protein